MPRIPAYTAQHSLDTDRGGMPSVRLDDAMGSALRRFSKSISQLELAGLSGNGAAAHRHEEFSNRRREQEARRLEFEKIRTVTDARTEMENALANRKEIIGGDGAGFYRAYVEQAVEPVIAAALSKFPPAEQEAIRHGIQSQAEPMLEAAAHIERDQSIRYFEAETDRIANTIYADVDLQPGSFENAGAQLRELLEASPVPAYLKPQKSLNLEQNLSRRIYDLMLEQDPDALVAGSLGLTLPVLQEPGDTAPTVLHTKTVDSNPAADPLPDQMVLSDADPRFLSLPFVERVTLLTNAISAMNDRTRHARVAQLTASEAAFDHLVAQIDDGQIVSMADTAEHPLSPRDKAELQHHVAEAEIDRKKGDLLLGAIEQGKASVNHQNKEDTRVADQLFRSMTAEMDNSQRMNAGRAFVRATGYIPKRAAADLINGYFEGGLDGALQAFKSALIYQQAAPGQFAKLTDGSGFHAALVQYRSNLDSGFSPEEAVSRVLRHTNPAA